MAFIYLTDQLEKKVLDSDPAVIDKLAEAILAHAEASRRAHLAQVHADERLIAFLKTHRATPETEPRLAQLEPRAESSQIQVAPVTEETHAVHAQSSL